MSEAAPAIFTDPSQSPNTVVILEDMHTLEEKLENMPAVQDEEQAALVSEYRAQFAKKEKALNKERLEMTKPIRELQTKLNQKYNVHIERAKRMVTLAGNLLTPWMLAQQKIREEAERVERERREEEERMEREEAAAVAEAERVAKETTDAEALKAAEAKVSKAKESLNEVSTRRVAPPPNKSVTGVMGSSTGLRKNWKYRVVNISEVPEEYLVAPEDRIHKGKVNAIAKKYQDTAGIPGIEFYAEDGLTSR